MTRRQKFNRQQRPVGSSQDEDVEVLIWHGEINPQVIGQ
jgi:hypothetical protein